MAEQFMLPEIGEGVVEGEIVEWHVSVGDRVDPDTNLVSVLTDKATVEIAADFSGVITQCNGAEGDVVAVGSALVEYDSGDGAATPAPAAAEAPQNSAQATAPKAEAGAVIAFPMPEIGEGVVEGEVVEWHVAVGDVVAADEPVVSVLTDKATVEITAPTAGTVVSLVGDAGDMLQVGEVIMTLQTSEAGVAVAQPTAVAAVAEAAAPVAAAAAPAAMVGEVDPADNPSISAFGTPLATPAVRRFARSSGVDLTRVRGTGPKHRITREDVTRAASATPAPAPAQAAAPKSAAPAPQPAAAAAPQPIAPAPAPTGAAIPVGEGEHREKIRGLRKAIHGAMTRSKTIAPHFTYVDEVEMDALVDLRTRLKQTAADEGVKLTYLPFIAKAVVLALKKFPILNSSVDDVSGEIVYKHYYNLGIATATKNGLTVPVVKAADGRSILDLAREVTAVTDRARNLKSTMDDITGGSFTITSLGRLGGLLATPIINYPEVGILGIHNLQDRPVVRDGQVVIRKMMNLSLSCDHRVVDGDVAAMFTQEIKANLEEPGKLMLHMI